MGHSIMFIQPLPGAKAGGCAQQPVPPHAQQVQNGGGGAGGICENACQRDPGGEEARADPRLV